MPGKHNIPENIFIACEVAQSLQESAICILQMASDMWPFCVSPEGYDALFTLQVYVTSTFLRIGCVQAAWMPAIFQGAWLQRESPNTHR